MIKKSNASLVTLVSILNDGAYHDGDTLGKKLKMTRSAVWKAIKKLETYGVNIDSVKGKGYAMQEPLILLDAAKIKQQLALNKVEVNVYEVVSSTNDCLKELKQQKGIKICLAEQQTSGRGRLGREWYSPFGRNIYLSCRYPFQKDISELAGLSLVVGLAVLRTLHHFGMDEPLVAKWPNDILYQQKKISGTLIDIQAEAHGASHAIIGIGINVNMLQDANRIMQAWTSMQNELGRYIDRNELSAELINTLLDYLTRFNQDGFQSFIEEWTEADCLTQQLITLKNLDTTFTGKVLGVNAQGNLLLECKDGTVAVFSSGDTSITKK